MSEQTDNSQVNTNLIKENEALKNKLQNLQYEHDKLLSLGIDNPKKFLCSFFKFFRDNGEAYVGMTIEEFVEEFLKLKK